MLNLFVVLLLLCHKLDIGYKLLDAMLMSNCSKVIREKDLILLLRNFYICKLFFKNIEYFMWFLLRLCKLL